MHIVGKDNIYLEGNFNGPLWGEKGSGVLSGNAWAFQESPSQ